MEIAFDTRLFNKQAELITALREQIARQDSIIERQRAASEFYLGLVEAIGDNITLQDEWRRFIAILRLVNPDLPGITQAENRFPDA